MPPTAPPGKLSNSSLTPLYRRSNIPIAPPRVDSSKGQKNAFLGDFGFFDNFWIFKAHFWVRRGPEMIVCHRPLTSLNMSPYRPIWTHFRPIFMIFIDLILQTGKAAGIWASCLDPRQVFNDFLKTKKMCNVRTINLAVVSSHIEPYGPISDQIS